MSKEFLFVLWAGGGNVSPQIVVARDLVARGHSVRMLAPAVLRDAIESAGITYEPYRQIPEHDESVAERSIVRDFEARSEIGRLAAARDNLVGGMAQPVAADVLSSLERSPADVVAFDYLLLGSLFAAEKARVPAAMLIHTIYPFPAPGLPPYGMGWRPMGGPIGRIREAGGRMIFRLLYERPLLPTFNKARATIGLDPLKSFDDLLQRVDRALVLTSTAFDYPTRLPDNVEYVGPQLQAPAPSSSWVSPWPDEDTRPLVVTALSTTHQGQHELLERIVAALGTLPVRALVNATGGAAITASTPSNVHVTGFVPHNEVLPGASAVVTHAGLGSVHAALAHGVPLVCLPIGRDQPDNAARVAAHGAGLRLSTKASPAAIAKAIERVLGEPAFTVSAHRLADAFQRDAAADRAIGAMEALAGEAPPRESDASPSTASLEASVR
jgi:UDP:flavonoid glycosyltransferase YjiC (YdhE family)